MNNEKVWVKNLADKQNFETHFLIKDKTVGVGKNGKSYMSVLLSDKSGQIDARIWENVNDLNDAIQIGDLVKLKGSVQLFQGRKQVVVHKIEPVMEHNLSMDDFVPVSKVDALHLYSELLKIISTIRNSHIQQLLRDSIEDAEIKNLILRAPAARSIHHAWQGGLVEHIISICGIMDFMAKHYPFLNRDFLIFGAIFHDIGKVWEITIDQGIQYTDRGRLLGHMQMACELIDRKSSRILGFDNDLRDLLKHIILSHHGKLEYGSPKRPKFLEAMMVAMIDELDSKVDTVRGFVQNERESGEKWSRYNTMFDRYFLLEDLNEKYK
jgi:3'-5' exoribonuclease